MKLPVSIRSEISYARDLVKAGVDAAASARKETAERAVDQNRTKTILTVWGPAVVGTALGVLSTRLSKERKSPYSAIVRGVVGGAIGLGSGVAWVSRDVTGAFARNASRNIGVVRDQRWLNKHPIAYA